jgi:hypothetical protein
MAEKKVNIDLKTRLGRASSLKAPSTTGTPVPGAAPPPPPAGIAPPPGIVQPSGIPAPPFAPQPTQRPAGPKIKADDPFQAVSADEVAAPRPQEIKVEIGHEVVQAQSKGRLYIAIAAVAAALLGTGIGYALGGMSAKADENKRAVQGAGEIAVGVEKAKSSIVALADKVDGAAKTMFKDKKFPDKFAKDLEGITIDFSSGDLAGKNINKLKPATVRALFEFARDAQELDAKRDWLRRLFEGRRAAIEDILTGAQNPKINYILFVGKAQKGPVGTFAQLKTPFEFNKDWPDKLTILGTNDQEIATERYKGGEPFVKPAKREGEAPTVYAIPIEPDGIKAEFPDPLGQRIEDELKNVALLIRGTPPGTPATQEKTGLIKMAEDLIQELKTIGAAR